MWAGVPGENPRMHGENMQTPCRKTPGVESGSAVLPPVLLCNPKTDFYFIFFFAALEDRKGWRDRKTCGKYSWGQDRNPGLEPGTGTQDRNPGLETGTGTRDWNPGPEPRTGTRDYCIKD
ncbi:hypothetical protein ILYODFUR_025410 [Ilyodon furcidens]|uniref:Uncharacterized protein n=1 Tax=Ilyodon furcidens TaxID=33524 RepID=A0ABV0V615_9TELE